MAALSEHNYIFCLHNNCLHKLNTTTKSQIQTSCRYFILCHQLSSSKAWSFIAQEKVDRPSSTWRHGWWLNRAVGGVALLASCVRWRKSSFFIVNKCVSLRVAFFAAAVNDRQRLYTLFASVYCQSGSLYYPQLWDEVLAAPSSPAMWSREVPKNIHVFWQRSSLRAKARLMHTLLGFWNSIASMTFSMAHFKQLFSKHCQLKTIY